MNCDLSFFIKLLAVALTIMILAYYIPNIILRSIRDFINIKKGGCNNGQKKEMEKEPNK